MNMFNALSDSLRATFALDNASLGAISACYFIANALLMYPVGMLLDRYNAKKILLFGLCLSILGSVFIALASSTAMVVVGRLLGGVANTFCFLSIIRIAVHWFKPEKLGFISGLIVTVGMSGGVLSQTPLLWLINRFTWHHALLLVSGLGVLIWLYIAVIVKEKPASGSYAEIDNQEPLNTRQIVRAFVQVASRKNNWCCGLYISLMNLPIMILAGLFGTNLLVHGVHLTALESSMVCMMLFVGMIFGSPFWGAVSDKTKGRLKPMYYAGILTLGSLLLVMLLPALSYNAYMVLFFALGFFSAGQVIGYPVIRESNEAGVVGAAMGFVSTIIMLLPAAIQPLFGLLINNQKSTILEHTSFTHGFLLLTIAIALGMVALVFLPETFGNEIK